MAHFQDGFIGRLQWNCTLKETEALSLCTDSHLPPALLSLCQMVERRFFTKWHGSPCSFMAQGSPYPRIPFQVTAGRWMEPGIWGCIVLLLLLFVCVHLFFSPQMLVLFPQGLGEIVLTTQWSVLLEPSVVTKPEFTAFTPVRHIVTITSLAHSPLSLTRKNKPPKLGWN